MDYDSIHNGIGSNIENYLFNLSPVQLQSYQQPIKVFLGLILLFKLMFFSLKGFLISYTHKFCTLNVQLQKNSMGIRYEM